MHLVKFTTNSNQEFINEPFKGSENKKNQQKVIKQSQLIENFTYKVLKDFFDNKIPEKIDEFINQKKAGKLLEVIEFTSGKALFVCELSEQQIKDEFKSIHQRQIEEANTHGSEHIISFNYVTSELPSNWQQHTYKELVEDINKLNPGYLMLEAMFEELMVCRDGMKYRKQSGDSIKSSDKDNIIDLQEVCYVNEPILNSDEEIEKQSYTKQSEEILYNKLLIYKIDLNNIGQLFENIKSKSISDYSMISIKFFELIRIEYIQKQLDSKDLKSKCMFAAGDDIMIVARFDELAKIQEILKSIIKKINDMFSDSIQVTYAAGLQVVDYRIPIRVYYQEVEKALGLAKKDKSKNMICFNNEVYSDQMFDQMIEYAMQIVWVENRFNESSSVYYNLMDRLTSDDEIDIELKILNILLNDNSDHKNVIGLFEQMINEQYTGLTISNVIQLAIHVSYVTNSESEMKSKCNLKAIENKLKAKPQINGIMEMFGTYVGFYDELLSNSDKDNEDYEDLIKKTIFRKKNNLYYKLEPYENKIKEFANENIIARKNKLLACIICCKIEKITLEETYEEN